ncbi:MAG: hypothetical protein KIS92_11445 [Planctomycetota bacterium]|nr:hypothetical protein [Planctomycetota bacterium]
MSPGKTTLILLALALALGGWAVYDMNTKPKLDEESFAWPLLRDFPVKEVTRIEIRREIPHPAGPLTRETLVFEKDGKAWRMLEPLQGEADATRVEGLMELGTSMWPSNLVEAGKDLEPYGLGATATRLTLIHPQGRGTILAGKISNLYSRVYAMKEGDARVGLMDPGFSAPLAVPAEQFLKKHQPAAHADEQAPELPHLPDFMNTPQPPPQEEDR